MARSDIVLDGMLEKWTNPISRWQPRYFVLDQRGILSYYLSRDHAQYAVSHRWAVDVATTTLVGNIPNEPLRFDIEFLSPDLSPGKVYLRAYSLYDRHAWIRGLLTAKRNAEQNQTPQDRFKSFVSVSLSRPLETGGKNRTTTSAYVPTKAVSTSVIENLASRVETICGRLGTGIGVIEEGLAGADSLRLSIMLADVARNCQDLFEVLSELERNSFTSSLFGRSLLSIERFKTGEDPNSHPSKPSPSSTHSQKQDHQQPTTPAVKSSPKHASSPLLAENMNDASGVQSETSSLSHYDMAPED